MNEKIHKYCLQDNQTISLFDPTIYMTRFIAVRFLKEGNGVLMIDLNPFIPFYTLLPQFYVSTSVFPTCCQGSLGLYYVIFIQRKTDWYRDEQICNKLGGRLPRHTSFEELSFVESLLLGATYNPDLTPVPSPFRLYPGSGHYLGQVMY